jgi:hypothetical protein
MLRQNRHDLARSCGIAAAALLCLGDGIAAQSQRPGPAIFDSAPNHIWNRTYELTPSTPTVCSAAHSFP